MSKKKEETPTGLKLWAPLIAVSMAMFIVVVDSTMMNVAVPTIVKDLKTNVSAVQGTISLYSMVMASLMLTGGKLGAMRGIKKMFVVGLVIYSVGTLIAAISWNIESLAFGWSFLEGIGAAMIMPLAFTLVVVNYDGRMRAVSFGILAGVQASAAAVGPILGGILTTFASWRWGFGGEVLIAIAIIPFLPSLKELVTAEEGTTLDWGGTVLSVLSMLSLVMGFLLAGRYGWWAAKRPFTIGDIPFSPLGLSPTPFLLALGAIFFVAFLQWQMRRERQGKTPLLRLGALANGRYLAGLVTYSSRSVFLAGFLFVVPLFMQSALGFSAFESGLGMLPFSIAIFGLSMGTANLGEKIAPKYLIQLGFGVIIIAVGIFIAVINLEMTVSSFIIPGLIFGAGLGLVMAQLTNLTLSSVKNEDTPEASGAFNALGELGTSLGTAVIGSLLMAFFLSGTLDGVLKTEKLTVSPAERSQLIVQLEDFREMATPAAQEALFKQLPDNIKQILPQLLNTSMVEAMQWTMVVIGFFALLALLLTTFFPKRAEPQKQSQQVP